MYFSALGSLVVLGAAFLLSPSPVRAQTTDAALPGGASSLRETFEDWAVACSAQAKSKACSLSQQQFDSKSRQRVLAIELRPSGAGLQGLLVLPFGLALDQGVTLQVDDGPAGPPLRFRTCLPDGCLVALNFDDKLAAILRKGTALTVKAVSDGGDPTSFRVSLKGLPGALTRVSTLLK